ncbi:hypothetical protein HN51_046218 [Arachis hypogaea]|uniref:Uncharacterized protein n=1 Tax=Arachis hypogaea TaxID=3818 RepID=A0A445ABT5_ARAHY|nr:uncharacterized protein LOC107622399 isoform X1 [Arachis ipaensis]XP_025631505.1 uncharacterized protein LOC112726362 [Arachis hypogaea]QHO22319.1 hypothetical protein DS421_12g354180 [Arachis hypogaea]RYR23920.1 hypothetical protein Ahy_B02g057404 [Arachis hypogaea]
MALATIASFPSIKFNTTHQNNSLIFLPKQHHSHRICKLRRIQFNGTGHNQQEESQQPQNNNNNNNNALLKVAWYGSELLGIAASALKPSSNEKAPQRLLESIDRDAVVDTIKQDFQRSYFVTGDLTLNAYEDDCEFADPAGSFKGLQRFKRNCTNFGSLLEKSNMKLMKWEDFEDKGIGHWRFSCVLSFPWRPILSATGYTEYYFDPQSGKVCRHVEHWNVPKMALFKQILKPSRGFGLKDYMNRWLKAFQVKI